MPKFRLWRALKSNSLVSIFGLLLAMQMNFITAIKQQHAYQSKGPEWSFHGAEITNMNACSCCTELTSEPAAARRAFTPFSLWAPAALLLPVPKPGAAGEDGARISPCAPEPAAGAAADVPAPPACTGAGDTGDDLLAGAEAPLLTTSTVVGACGCCGTVTGCCCGVVVLGARCACAAALCFGGSNGCCCCGCCC